MSPFIAHLLAATSYELGPHRVKVYKDALMSGDMGSKHEASDGQIINKIDNSLLPEAEIATRIHELLETVNDEFELQLSHETISTLEMALAQAFLTMR